MPRRRNRKNTAEHRRSAKKRLNLNKQFAVTLISEYNFRDFLHEKKPEIVADMIERAEKALRTETQYVPKSRRRRGKSEPPRKLGRKDMEAFCIQRKTSLSLSWLNRVLGVNELHDYLFTYVGSLPETDRFRGEVGSGKAADYALRQLIFNDLVFQQELMEAFWQHFSPGTIVHLLAENKKHKEAAEYFQQKLELFIQ